MENKFDSKWSGAAKDGLILSLVTVVVITLQVLTESTFLNLLLWIIKLVGSIWILSIFMKRFHTEKPGESAFTYGFKVCLCSAVVCAVYSLLLYGFIFPDYASESINKAMESLGSKAALPEMEEITDVMAKMEDNYAQIQCISTFVWCTLFGLIVSAIIGRSLNSKKDIFQDDNL